VNHGLVDLIELEELNRLGTLASVSMSSSLGIDRYLAHQLIISRRAAGGRGAGGGNHGILSRARRGFGFAVYLTNRTDFD
jgi:hypothetical protein